MNSTMSLRLLVALLLLAAGGARSVLQAQPTDPGWPRVFKEGKTQLTVYQPQVDYWNGYTNLHYRCAIAVKGVAKQEKFGVAEVDAVTVVDHAARIVALVPSQRDLRFPNTSDSELASLRRVVDTLKPPGQALTVSLDRVLAYLDPAGQPTQAPVAVNLEPPRILYSRKPAILVMLLGEPEFKPVEPGRTDLMFALNTNWDLFYDTAKQRHYLLNQDHWLTAEDVKGPWIPAQELPAPLLALPDHENWVEVRRNLPGRRVQQAPEVLVTTEPAELILTDGEPAYSPIKGTRLLRMTNTESVLFLHSGEGKFYFLVAGRWFRAPRLEGPWSAASADMPDDFLRIPDTDPAAFVKSSVPGTRDSKDAVLLASVPKTETVSVTNAPVKVTYNGTPQFVTITNTVVQCAVNSPQQVFLVGGAYYCCDQGVWFTSGTATGPWTFCTNVPAPIYTIPPSNPNHNVTYVVVQSSTPTTVTYSQTSGYSGEYVATTGVLMFGAGMLVGAAIANDNHYYYPPYPCHYSYGCGAVYHHGYGGYYYRGGAAYGPYGGAGYATAYNPATGTYSRGAYAYGPYGSASARAAYNPYTGAYARGGQVNTAYGSAGRVAGYNPYTGTRAAGGYRSTASGSASWGAAYNSQTGSRAAGGQVNTAYGSAGRGAAYNPSTGNAARGAYAQGQYGSAAGFQTSQGSGGVAWDTQNGQGAVARSGSGDVYAAKDGTVYKKDANGGWSSNSGSGWQSPQSAGATSASRSGQAQSPASASASSGSWSQQRQSLEAQAQSRQWGNHQTQRSQSSPGTGASPRSRSSGGRRR